MKTGDEHSLRLMRVAVVLAGVLPLLFLAAAAWTSYGASIAAAEASLDELATCGPMRGTGWTVPILAEAIRAVRSA